MPNVAHCVSLRGAAGVELQFAEFVSWASRRHPEWRHDLLSPDRAIDGRVATLGGKGLRSIRPIKHVASIKLPPAFRRSNCRRHLRRAGSDVVLVWNRSARLDFLLDAAGPERCVHYEHGAAWFGGHEAMRRSYFRRVPAAIAVSDAAAQVLRQIWDFAGDIRVCRNALRPSLAPSAAERKAYPAGRPVRFGVACRLFPVKGVAIALHALRIACQRGLEAELTVAGAGPQLQTLRRLAATLGIAPRVRFLGQVERMDSFYRDVDCLVHVPLSEAFGLVAVEAAAQGCPVIAAAVDGLPDAVPRGAGAFHVEPTLPLADYAGLGGDVDGLPPQVFDPATGRVTAARIVDPSELARSMAEMFDDAERYESTSASASAYVASAHTFDRYVDELLEALAASVKQ